ncbi:11903_t:CDS:1, partial [Dentiscutata heterogama]
GGTRIKKNIKSMLERFFLNGNLRSQERMNAQTMYDELLKYVITGEIEEEDIPKTSTIQNWISSYTHIFEQRATEDKLEDVASKN